MYDPRRNLLTEVGRISVYSEQASFSEYDAVLAQTKKTLKLFLTELEEEGMVDAIRR